MYQCASAQLSELFALLSECVAASVAPAGWSVGYAPASRLFYLRRDLDGAAVRVSVTEDDQRIHVEPGDGGMPLPSDTQLLEMLREVLP